MYIKSKIRKKGEKIQKFLYLCVCVCVVCVDSHDNGYENTYFHTQ